MMRVNEDNKSRLESIDMILIEELQDFEGEIVVEIDKVASDFMSHQASYAKQVFIISYGSD